MIGEENEAGQLNTEDNLEEGVDKAIWVHVKVRSDCVEEEQRDP